MTTRLSTPVRRSEPTEAQITKAVMQHWHARRLPQTLVASIPNMGARGQYGLTPGLPDLLVLAPGLPVGFIELKTERGPISKHQLAFRDLCISVGANMCIPRGLDQAIDVLEGWNVIRRSS